MAIGIDPLVPPQNRPGSLLWLGSGMPVEFERLLKPSLLLGKRREVFHGPDNGKNIIALKGITAETCQTVIFFAGREIGITVLMVSRQ